MTESPYPMVPVSEALAIVLDQAPTLSKQVVSLRNCLGLILAEDIIATEPQPPFPASVKDGFAVVATDGPGEYPVIGEVTAGHPADFRVRPGVVAYITTGAPVPEGADGVVMVEDTESFLRDGQRWVRIKRSIKPGDDIRPVGVDVEAGQRILAAGERLGPAEIGLLATVGVTNVAVHPRPRVAVLSTGDELIDPSQQPGPGQIRDSNRAMLLAAVQAVGGEPVDLGLAGDTQAELEKKVRAGLNQADILLTSGGVSMGDLDLIKPLLEHAGTVHFGRIHMKPGKPLTFATVDADQRRRLVFGLPGNPVSSLVTFYLMAVPALRKMAGWREPALPRVQARLAQTLPLDPHRPEFHRATLRWDDEQQCLIAHSTGRQASSRLLSMRTANALLELPQGEGELPAGTWVHAQLIGEL
jgi:gephyrin